MQFKDYLFGLLPSFFKENDTYKDTNDEGLLERYLRNFGLEIDGEVMNRIEDYLTQVDPLVCDEKFLNHIAYALGNPPDITSSVAEYRKFLIYSLAIYKIKGTRRSYEILFNLLGLNVFIKEEYIDDVLYDNAEIYDKGAILINPGMVGNLGDGGVGNINDLGLGNLNQSLGHQDLGLNNLDGTNITNLNGNGLDNLYESGVIRFPDKEIYYDTFCEGCSFYKLYFWDREEKCNDLTSWVTIPQDIIDKIVSIIDFIEPINAKLKALVRNYNICETYQLFKAQGNTILNDVKEELNICVYTPILYDTELLYDNAITYDQGDEDSVCDGITPENFPRQFNDSFPLSFL